LYTFRIICGPTPYFRENSCACANLTRGNANNCRVNC